MKNIMDLGQDMKILDAIERWVIKYSEDSNQTKNSSCCCNYKNDYNREHESIEEKMFDKLIKSAEILENAADKIKEIDKQLFDKQQQENIKEVETEQKETIVSIRGSYNNFSNFEHLSETLDKLLNKVKQDKLKIKLEITIGE